MNIPRLFIILLIHICIYSCSNTPTPVQQSSLNLDSLEQVAFRVFKENPSTAIPLYEQLADVALNEDVPSKAAIYLLNLANIYDEHLNDYHIALNHAQQSLAIWEIQKDSLQAANLYKYVGLLEAKLGRFDIAKNHIDKALLYYSQLGFRPGLYVTKANLAQVYFLDNNWQASVKLYHEVADYWRQENNLGRVFTNNLLGIKLYQQLTDIQNLEIIIAENDQLLASSSIDEFSRNEYLRLKTEIEL